MTWQIAVLAGITGECKDITAWTFIFPLLMETQDSAAAGILSIKQSAGGTQHLWRNLWTDDVSELDPSSDLTEK